MTDTKTNWVRFDWPLSGRCFENPPVPGYTLRAARTDDVVSMREIVGLAYRSDSVWNENVSTIQERVMERVKNRIADPEAHFVLAVYCGQVIGLNGVAITSYTQMNLITGICVSTEHQGRGIGKALLSCSLTWLRDQGLSVATVTTDKRAIAAYVYSHFNACRVDNVNYPEAF